LAKGRQVCPKTVDHPILVVVGSSAGVVQALSEMVSTLPGQTPWARTGEIFEMRVVVGEGATRRMFEARGRSKEGERIGSGVLRRVSEG
jgi:hypothetical protein